jgi:DNA-binding transcriptional MocR family regulator
MKKKIITGALAVSAVLALSGASLAAFAAGTTGASGTNQNAQYTAMHNSPAMQQAMAQFSPELRAQCNAMHAQMTSYMSTHMNGANGSGMMGGHTMGGW